MPFHYRKNFMNHNTVTLLFLTLVSGTSCKLFKHRKQEPVPPPPPVEQVLTPRQDKKAVELADSKWVFLSGKGNLQVDMGGMDLSLNAGFRMKRDSILWLNVSPGLGISGVRALITRDSVKVVNFIEKYYSAYSIEYLQNMLGAKISLNQLQNLMMGLPLFDTATYKYDSLLFQWTGLTEGWYNRLFFEEGVLVASALAQEPPARTLSARYSGRLSSRESSEVFMPADIRVKALSGEKESQVVYSLQELSSAVVTQYPFNIPANYERR